MTRIYSKALFCASLAWLSADARAQAPVAPASPDATSSEAKSPATTSPAVKGDDSPKGEQPAPGQPAVIEDKRAYGVLPNYRTAEADTPFVAITTKQKFTIARKDTFDWPSYIIAGVFAGISQLGNSNPSFGQGTKGYARRYLSSVADQDIGNFMTEAILPSLFHQDPRYFRSGHGTIKGRIAYAASRVVVARSDSGKWGFNASEFLGNGIVASLGNAYYPDAVGFSPTMQRMFTQIGTDAISQVLKEFWPDVKRKLSRRRESGSAD